MADDTVVETWIEQAYESAYHADREDFDEAIQKLIAAVRAELHANIAAIRAVRAETLPSVTCINCGHRMDVFYRDGKPLR